MHVVVQTGDESPGETYKMEQMTNMDPYRPIRPRRVNIFGAMPSVPPPPPPPPPPPASGGGYGAGGGGYQWPYPRPYMPQASPYSRSAYYPNYYSNGGGGGTYGAVY